MVLVFDVAFSLLASCQPTGPSTPNYSGYENYCSAFNGIVLGYGLFRVAHFLSHYEHELIAGFTIVLAVSTILLWDSTRRLWKASQEQLIAEQRAWVSLEDVKLLHPTKFTEDGFTFRVSATAKHHGETGCVEELVTKPSSSKHR